MKKITVLIPTYNRKNSLASLLTSLCFQSSKSFKVVISDQSQKFIGDDLVVKAIIKILQNHGNSVKIFQNLPRKGLAQQRQFLLNKSNTPYSLFIDDDVVLEPFVVKNLFKTIQEEKCGLVGMALIGLSFKNDIRPSEQRIELWKGNVKPEKIKPDSNEWKRYKLHNAANIAHVTEKMKATPDSPKKYKIAWVGGCVMYDTEKLKKAGGFKFWQKLPKKHAGEDVLAQIKVLEKYGGCGVIPSGAYHLELPTTVKDRKIDAPRYPLKTE